MSLRLNGKRFYCTYPRNDTTKEYMETMLTCGPHSKDLEWYVIGRERHQDGGLHLHAAFAFTKKKNYKDPHIFDYLTYGSKHGNYQTIRNVKQCLRYCVKDGDWCAGGIDVTSILAKGTSTSTMVATKAQNGSTIEEIDSKYPGFVMMNLQKIQAYITFQEIKNLHANRMKWVPIDTKDMQGSDLAIANWLNRNMFQTRYFKQKQLWIWGPPDMYKSTLKRWLEQYATGYNIPKGEDFYDHYHEAYYDFAYLDEYKGQKTIQWLDEWLDGSVGMNIRVKGGQRLKRKSIPTIIFSNYDPAGCYHKVDPSKLAPLLVRLEVVNVTTRIFPEILGNFLANEPGSEGYQEEESRRSSVSVQDADGETQEQDTSTKGPGEHSDPRSGEEQGDSRSEGISDIQTHQEEETQELIRTGGVRGGDGEQGERRGRKRRRVSELRDHRGIQDDQEGSDQERTSIHCGTETLISDRETRDMAIDNTQEKEVSGCSTGLSDGLCSSDGRDKGQLKYVLCIPCMEYSKGPKCDRCGHLI